MQRSSGLHAASVAFPLAVAAAGAAAWLVAAGERTGAGAVVVLAAGLVVGGRLRRGEAGPRASFAGSLLGRAAETAPLAALAWTLLPSRAGVAAVVALAASFVASYVHVKGAGLGFSAPEHPALLPLRIGAVGAGLLTGWVEAGLWASVAGSAAAVAMAASAVAGQEEPA